MIHYTSVGSIPPKRHIIHKTDGPGHKSEGIYYEHVVTTEGFDRAYSILYHTRPPTRVTKVERLPDQPLTKAANVELRHHHLKSADLPRAGDPITGRVPMMFNDDLVAYRCKPAEHQSAIFRNGHADEMIYIHEGSGTLETHFGTLRYGPLDYVYVPRTTNYRLVPDDPTKEDHLIIESFGSIRLPPRYLNPDGQLMLGAPYYHRDFRIPTDPHVIDDDAETDVIIKAHETLTKVTQANHPFDVIGWDGHVYPFCFNAMSFEPLTGTVHLPPPYQQTFEARGYVICTFAPRHLDHHPDAIKVPYVHSNVEADEVLFYSRGDFGSRRGVEQASMTLHPGGIAHGPHPGTIKKSMPAQRTEELAVMFDTDRPLHLTKEAIALDDPTYPYSWSDG